MQQRQQPGQPPASFMRGPTPVADILKDMHRGAFPEQSTVDLDLGDDEADEMFGELAGDDASAAAASAAPAPPPAAAARRRRGPAVSRKTLNLS